MDSKYEELTQTTEKAAYRKKSRAGRMKMSKQKGRIMMDRRLYKSNENKMVDGVCGGIAEYFNIDPTLVRLGWVLLCALGGSGIAAYIVAAIIIPRDPEN